MIVERIDNFKLYNSSLAWKKAFEFIAGLKDDIADGEYEIQGKDIFARVQTYETCVPWEAALEAHRKYVDVQCVLKGAESIDWYPLKTVSVKDAYNDAKDVEFYHRLGDAWSRVDLYPGVFAAFFPQDAHMPKLMVGEQPVLIKKVVIKINVDLLK